ncbi:hypothetical protein K469DRAFT_689346 [Zopfia rhizophila CBS 207.26]|uniref:Uncharacterized protein n=1 Tax=Zopfia rhizophila CBS 207.26 TaxID=1314779 RepID=A0A6A6ET49_9PEZI|nr:hypothetical protein K469DRAFT_689346 [Zopfia rhizophila CBS 207.26]
MPVLNMSILRDRLPPIFKKAAWPNPQESIGEWLSKMGSHNCWEAVGLARSQWTRLARDIQKHLEDSHDSIPKGAIWSGYMIGRTKESARPTVVFCSIDPPSRKQVRKIVLASGLLENYPGCRTAECSKPPDFDQLGPLGDRNPTNSGPRAISNSFRYPIIHDVVHNG